MIKNGLPAIHPGGYLAEILEEYHMLKWRYSLAEHSINRQPIANLQTAYDLKTTEAEMGERLSAIPGFVHA